MSNTPWLPAAEDVQTRNLERRAGTAERLPQFFPMVLPFAPIGGTPRDSGYWSINATSLTEIFRSDCYIYAPVLVYDFQLSTAYGAATSINYRIQLFGDGIATNTLLTGSGGNGDQIAGELDLFDEAGADVFTRYASIRLSVSRTGGSGEGAGVRMVKPWLLAVQ